MKYLLFILSIYLYTTILTASSSCKDFHPSTPVTKVITITPKKMVSQLRATLQIASFNNLHISMKGSQHSQGGHTIARNGLQLDFKQCNAIRQLSDSIIRVQCGATWKDVLEYLHPKGLSVHIMQSDFDFSIGGTISTNVHGWQLHTPPIIDTIEGLHLMLADGSILYCNRQLYPDLFSATIGGYGLMGIILDIDLRVTKNRMYTMSHWVGETRNFSRVFKEMAQNPNARLFFGRFDLNEEQFLNQLMLIAYNETSEPLKSKPLKTHPILEGLTYEVFRKTYNNNSQRIFRWNFETGEFIRRFIKKLTRNQLLYHSVNNYFTHDTKITDVLQEYFIPEESFEQFVSLLRSMQSELLPHLMNVTLRQVNADSQSLLAYAPTDCLCFVMFFRGRTSSEFEKTMQQLSIKLTEEALTLGGTYYLPYRPYQTKEQFHRAYPRYVKFKELKLQYDPKGLFQNQFYQNYLE